MQTKVSILFLFFLLSVPLSGQEYNFRLYFGSNYYQGDLAPRKSPLSFSPGKAGWGGSMGMKLTDWMDGNVRFMLGQIHSDDDYAVDGTRRERNLNFYTPFYEVGLNAEFNINKLMPFLNKYGLEYYFTLGVNFFHFEPKTIYQGKVVNLQPLGTEGQGLPGFPDRYSCNQINIPMGIAIRFPLSPELYIGLEFSPRYTFTDYLDDVSTIYVNYYDLIEANRPVTAALSNRTGELYGTDILDVPTGTPRGNPEDKDWYFFAGISISYHFGKDVEDRILQAKLDKAERKKKREEMLLNEEQ